MRDEQQGQVLLLDEPLVVKSRNDRLAGTRRRDHEVSVSVVYLALHLQAIKHLGLVGVGANRETRDRDRSAGTCAPPCFRQHFVEAVRVQVWVIGYEGWILPVCVKTRFELCQEFWRVVRREPNVPLQTV